MRIKTSELTGAALDWAVTKCEGNTNGWCGMVISRPMSYIFRPSTNWAQGGPIIEREEIAIFLEYPKEWGATDGNYSKGGDTPLIAAMRCYVASKLGDEVEIPKEMT
jgi:hypothetical protein